MFVSEKDRQETGKQGWGVAETEKKKAINELIGVVFMSIAIQAIY